MTTRSSTIRMRRWAARRVRSAKSPSDPIRGCTVVVGDVVAAVAERGRGGSGSTTGR